MFWRRESDERFRAPDEPAERVGGGLCGRAAGASLAWHKPQTIARIELSFDTDFDHPMESVLMGHPERVMPFCVRDVALAQPARVPTAITGRGKTVAQAATDGSIASATEGLLFEVSGNHHSRQVIRLRKPVTTDCLELRLLAPSASVPAALFEVRCYAESRELI